jgi:hypothetical protein
MHVLDPASELWWVQIGEDLHITHIKLYGVAAGASDGSKRAALEDHFALFK